MSVISIVSDLHGDDIARALPTFTGGETGSKTKGLRRYAACRVWLYRTMISNNECMCTPDICTVGGWKVMLSVYQKMLCSAKFLLPAPECY